MMKRRILSVAALLLAASLSAFAQEIVKTGINLGPLPLVAYDADKGMQYGATLAINDFGDGSSYPNYKSKLFFELSFFSKGSKLAQIRYDNKVLIPNVRWSSTLRVNLDNAADFYGFNGYESYFDWSKVADGKAGRSFQFTPFYRYRRNDVLFKSDFIGRINDALSWEAGIFANYIGTGSIDYDNINKNKSDDQKYPSTLPTLFSIYKDAGIISSEDANGGFASGVRGGMVYDTRDKEGAPSKGIWTEAHFAAALPLISKTPYLKYSITHRQYIPIVGNDVLTFAYRLNYEGTIGKAPFYSLGYLTVMGERSDIEGMGGFNTIRGLMMRRVVGLDMADYNAELRWRFSKFTLWKQNIALGLNLFSDGAMVTRKFDIDETALSALQATSPAKIISGVKESMHMTVGAGFRFIMNENFIVAADYGMPLMHLCKNSVNYDQDGTGALYVNLGYLF